MSMNFDSNQTRDESSCSPAQALAMKNAALRAVLGYLEHKHGPDEWFKDELAYRFHRMVKMALDTPCELENGQPSRFLASGRNLENQS